MSDPHALGSLPPLWVWGSIFGSLFVISPSHSKGCFFCVCLPASIPPPPFPSVVQILALCRLLPVKSGGLDRGADELQRQQGQACREGCGRFQQEAPLVLRPKVRIPHVCVPRVLVYTNVPSLASGTAVAHDPLDFSLRERTRAVFFGCPPPI